MTVYEDDSSTSFLSELFGGPRAGITRGGARERWPESQAEVRKLGRHLSPYDEDEQSSVRNAKLYLGQRIIFELTC